MKLTAGAFQHLRLTGILLLLATVTTAGLLYWNSVERQRQYLTSRDFRLLTVLATQVQSLLEGDGRIFQSAVDDIYGTTGESRRQYQTLDAWRTAAASDVPILREATFGPIHPPTGVIKSASSRLTLVGDSRFRLRVEIGQDTSSPILTVLTPLTTLLGATFSSKLRQGVFDTLALATPDGRVVFVTGRRQQELQSTPLDALIPTTIADSQRFQQMARTISVQDAIVAGVQYKLFLQPCCATVSDGSLPGTARPGLLVAGLIEADTLHGAALAISPTLVIAGILGVLLALVIWPFLKLSFMGDRQRVTVWDVIQLAVCSILGLAVAAIVLITFDVYERLKVDIDEQLERLGEGVHDHLRAEIDLAYKQMAILQGRIESAIAEDEKEGKSGREVFPCLRSDDSRCLGLGKLAQSSDFETFALINEEGWQQIKGTPSTFVPSRIRVQGRAYVDAIVENRYWRGLKQCTPQNGDPPGCFLESVWSWTDGQPQAVLSKPMPERSPYKVAALAFKLRTLIDPVLPPGFEVALIDDTGTVLFHSDRQRNVQENLFIETDQNRRLRALVAGHSAGAVSIQYWGRPFRAHVEPTGIPNWWVVTMSDQGAAGGLVLEWTAVSLLMLSVYLVIWISCVFLALKMGAPWMWPDIDRQERYAVLAGLYALLFVIFAMVASTGDTPRLLVTAVAITAAAWALAFVLLRQRPPNGNDKDTKGNDAKDAKRQIVRAWSRAGALFFTLFGIPPKSSINDAKRRTTVARTYSVAGALFLTLCGTVPGVAFVVRSYDMHVESYVKHRQLGLARALATRAEQASGSPNCGAQAEAKLQFDRNCFFFFDTTVSLQRGKYADLQRDPKSRTDDTVWANTTHHGFVQSLLEDYLPYYAESSVEMRELLHDHAADDTWQSTRADRGRLELRIDPKEDGGILVSSLLPAAVPRWPWRGTAFDGHHVESRETSVGTEGPLAEAGGAPGADEDHDKPVNVWSYLAPFLLLCLIGVAYGIVRFVLRHVYLLGVSEPLWATKTESLMATAGANVLILCNDSSKRAGELRDTSLLSLGTIARSGDPSSEWRRTLVKISRRDHALVVKDLDQDLEDVELTRSKLELLDEVVNDPTRTVVLLLQISPATFQDSLRRGRDTTLPELWSRLVKAFVVLDRRGDDSPIRSARSAAQRKDKAGRRSMVKGEPDELASLALMTDPSTKATPATPTGQSSPATANKRWLKDWWDSWEWVRPRRKDAQAALESMLGQEGEHDRFIRAICEDIRNSTAFKSGGLTADQIVDEINERAATHYQRLWASCSEDERVVLGHVAADGLTTAASRRVVRRLLVRELLNKDPDLKLMNRTFRNFIMSPEIQRHVRTLEGSAEPSTWDRLRVPFALAAVSAGVFLFTTQRDMFNQTVTVVTAMAAAVPTVFRALSVIAQRDGGSPPSHT